MLQKLSDRVTECLARAAEAERCAREATDPAARADLLDMARRWGRLAESMQYVESVDQFLSEIKTGRELPRPKG